MYGCGLPPQTSGKVNRRYGRIPDSINFVVTTQGITDFPEGLLTRATTVKVSVVELGNLACSVHGID